MKLLCLRHSINRLLLHSLKPHLNNPIKSVRNISLTNVVRDIFTVQDEDDFNERVLKSKEPLIVDFYATWCGPCKVLAPRLETIIGGKSNKVHLAKIDVDENETIAAKYDISSIPAVFAFKDGKVIDKFIGLKDEDELRAFIAKLIRE